MGQTIPQRDSDKLAINMFIKWMKDAFKNTPKTNILKKHLQDFDNAWKRVVISYENEIEQQQARISELESLVQPHLPGFEDDNAPSL